MDVFITVPNQQENVTITDKSIWNQEDADKWLTIIQAPVEKA